MVDLPIELWHLIFDHLQLVDLSPFALVSKAVYLAVKAYRIHEIAVTGRVNRWFHYTTPITDHKHQVDFTMASILKRSSFDFDYLKRLKIGRSSAIDDLDMINRFVHLEELDIDLANYENKKSWTLLLANLKVLYLFMSDHLPYVELDTPRLSKVCTFDLKKLEFIYPESVRCIQTYYHSGKLSMFRNLEYLTFTNYYNKFDFSSAHDFRSFDQFSLTALKKLKEIEFHYYLPYEKENLHDIKEATSNLLGLQRPDLKVFWQDVQVTDPNLLTEYERTDLSVRSLLAFQMQHYELLRDKIDFLDYGFNESMRKLLKAGFNPRSEEFLSKLLAKYSFRKISVTGQVEERELLFQLIARSPSLLCLNFSNSDLDQSFFDQMADTIHLNGIPLQLLGIENSAVGVLNFEFVLRLRDLLLFSTDQKLPTKLIPKLFELSMLDKLVFSSGCDSVLNKIERISARRFLLNGMPLSRQELMKRFNRPDLTECGLM